MSRLRLIKELETAYGADFVSDKKLKKFCKERRVVKDDWKKVSLGTATIYMNGGRSSTMSIEDANDLMEDPDDSYVLNTIHLLAGAIGGGEDRIKRIPSYLRKEFVRADFDDRIIFEYYDSPLFDKMKKLPFNWKQYFPNVK